MQEANVTQYNFLIIIFYSWFLHFTCTDCSEYSPASIFGYSNGSHKTSTGLFNCRSLQGIWIFKDCNETVLLKSQN